MTTSSAEVGTLPLLQLEPTFQLPPEVLVHWTVAACAIGARASVRRNTTAHFAMRGVIRLPFRRCRTPRARTEVHAARPQCLTGLPGYPTRVILHRITSPVIREATFKV